MDDVQIRERAVAEYAIVRGDARVLGAATGFALPEAPNTVASEAAHDAWWLGPDEWLLVSREEAAPRLERTLRPLLAGQFASVVDVSSGFVMLHLSGARAREILRKGCPLDVHPRVFRIGMCAQSHYFKAAIILRPVADDAFEVIVRRSFADYTIRMLRDAADC